MSALRRYLDTLLALFALIGLAVTLMRPNWVEGLTGLDLDGGSGAVEWVVVTVLAVLAIVFGARAWRVPRPTTGHR